MRLRPGSRFNQAIKGYFCTESSDQGVRKSGDQGVRKSGDQGVRKSGDQAPLES